MEHQDRLKFSVYLRRDGRLQEFYQISRTPSGLYFNEVRSPIRSALKGQGVKMLPGSSSSYHSSGMYWDKHFGRRDRKIRDTPLAEFSGARTYSTQLCVITSMELQRPADSVRLRAEDVVFERYGPFGIEIILSDSVFEISPEPDRLNSVTYVKEQVFPAIMIEVFDSPTGVFPRMRFKRAEPLSEGENFVSRLSRSHLTIPHIPSALPSTC
jgi:hypothetical protein